MQIKTYGVQGFIAWQCEIPVGKAKAVVHFSGGALTAYGMTPAEYSTSDPVKQAIIEGSDFYKKGKIQLLSVKGEAIPKKEKGQKRKEEAAGANTQKQEEHTGEAEEVEMHSLPEAQEYLRERFGIATSKSRSIEKAEQSAKENGIRIKWVE